MASNNPMVPTPTTPGGLTHDESMYRGAAMSCLRRLKDANKGLLIYHGTYQLPNGVEVFCNVCGNKEDVYVRVPVSAHVVDQAAVSTPIVLVLLHQGAETNYYAAPDYFDFTSSSYWTKLHMLGLVTLPNSPYHLYYSYLSVGKDKTVVSNTDKQAPELYYSEPFPSIAYLDARAMMREPMSFWVSSNSTYVGVFKRSRYIYCKLDSNYNGDVYTSAYYMAPIGCGWNQQICIAKGGATYLKYFGNMYGLDSHGYLTTKSLFADSAAIASFVIDDKSYTFVLGTASLMANETYGQPPVLITNGSTKNTVFMYEEGIEGRDKITNTKLMTSTNGVLLPPCTNVVFDSTGKKAYGFCTEYDYVASEDIDNSENVAGSFFNDSVRVSTRHQQYTFTVDITCVVVNDIAELRYTVVKTKFDHKYKITSSRQPQLEENEEWFYEALTILANAPLYEKANYTFSRIHAVDVVGDIPVLCYEDYIEAHDFSELERYQYTFEWLDPQTGEPKSLTKTWRYCSYGSVRETKTRRCGAKTLVVADRLEERSYHKSGYTEDPEVVSTVVVTSPITSKTSTPQIEDLRTANIWGLIHSVELTSLYNYSLAANNSSGVSDVSTEYTIKRGIMASTLAVFAPKEDSYWTSSSSTATSTDSSQTISTSWGGFIGDVGKLGTPFQRDDIDWFSIGTSINYLVSLTLDYRHLALSDIINGTVLASSSVVLPIPRSEPLVFMSKSLNSTGGGITVLEGNISGDTLYDSNSFYRWFFKYPTTAASYLPQN